MKLLRAIAWLGLSGVMFAGCSRPIEDPKPNVILIVIDTLRGDKLGCYGGRPGVSDEIDAMAARGILFENVTSPCSWTRPSMGSMLTGQYPRDLGLYRERAEALPDDAVTLAEHLKANGFRTLGYTANPNINKTYNFHQGFDEYYDSLVVFDWMTPNEESIMRENSDLHTAQQLFDSAVKDVHEAPERRTYIQINLMEVHEWHLAETGPIRPESREQFEGDDWPTLYDESIWQTSHELDNFLNTLKEIPGWEDAWLVITSDHGEGLLDHPGIIDSEFHGRHLYTTQTHVPFIITRLGGPIEPMRIQERVRLLDLPPTIVDIADVPPLKAIEGKSLVPLTEGGTVDLPEYFVTESAFRGHDKSAVVGPGWRYYVHRDGHDGLDPEELQAVGEPEIGASTNKVEDNPEIANAMKRYFETWEAEHPRRKPTTIEGDVSAQELEQLQSLGYLN